MKTMIRLALVVLISVFGFRPAEAEASVVPPVLEKVYVNSDSMQAVLYWNPTHSAEENPILDYAATIDGSNFFPLSVGYQKKYISVVSLPNRTSSTKYIFAVAPILQSGLGPTSNYVRGEVSPYVIPIEIGNIVPLSDGFSFEVKDLSLPGYSSSVQYLISDIIGNGDAYVEREGKEGLFSIRGLSKGEKATVTLSKRVGNCPGFTAVLACPFSTAKIITGQALGQLQAPRFSGVESLNDGFRTKLINFDSGVKYTTNSPAGVTVTIDEIGNIDVRGLASDTTIKFVVTATSAGFAPAQSTLEGKSLAQTYSPIFDTPKMTSSGFTIRIKNFDSKFGFKFATDVGAASINSAGIISVTGLGAGVSSVVKVMVYKEDVLIYETNIAGKSQAKKATAKR
jgi:hypothetical protein